MKVAISGCKHGHICSIAKACADHPELEVVAMAEDQPDKYAGYVKNMPVGVTHSNLDDMLAEVDFDILSVGDAYGLRGEQVVKAMRAGKHIMGDKPLCTSMSQMREIRALAAEKNLAVIVAFTLRYAPHMITGRKLLLDGAIGEVATATVFGHHPLSYKAGRPDWYFEQGMHGGTITDIMCHTVDSLKWLTGHAVVESIAARVWNQGLPEVPWFQDGAMAMLRLENGAGVLSDVSYKAPATHGFSWAFHFWGTKGYLLVDPKRGCTLRVNDKPEETFTDGEAPATNFVDDLVAEIKGDASAPGLITTAESLDSSEKTLLIQAAADNGIMKAPV